MCTLVLSWLFQGGSITVKAVMSSPFLHKTIFFSESCVGDLMLYVAIKFDNKNILDVGMVIFGFCQHLGPFLKKMLG